MPGFWVAEHGQGTNGNHRRLHRHPINGQQRIAETFFVGKAPRLAGPPRMVVREFSGSEWTGENFPRGVEKKIPGGATRNVWKTSSKLQAPSSRKTPIAKHQVISIFILRLGAFLVFPRL